MGVAVVEAVTGVQGERRRLRTGASELEDAVAAVVGRVTVDGLERDAGAGGGHHEVVVVQRPCDVGADPRPAEPLHDVAVAARLVRRAVAAGVALAVGGGVSHGPQDERDARHLAVGQRAAERDRQRPVDAGGVALQHHLRYFSSGRRRPHARAHQGDLGGVHVEVPQYVSDIGQRVVGAVAAADGMGQRDIEIRFVDRVGTGPSPPVDGDRQRGLPIAGRERQRLGRLQQGCARRETHLVRRRGRDRHGHARAGRGVQPNVVPVTAALFDEAVARVDDDEAGAGFLKGHHIPALAALFFVIVGACRAGAGAAGEVRVEVALMPRV